ncbi:MAG TPA: hypothetical protein ENJ24_02385 [Gammaproteobacteria bacterium]|nr:hypothetical protein [Gammaproteobacteria bacterium]
MPYLTIRTNRPVPEQARYQLLNKASALISKQLGKSENYVMASFEPPMTMLFGGSEAPLAYLELKSIGLPEQQVPALSEALCSLLEQEIGVPKERIYIEFSSAARNLWGWNGSTF